MTHPSSANLYSVATGTANTAPFIEIFMARDPEPTDVQGPQGQFQIQQRWWNTSTGSEWVLTAFNAFNGVISAVWGQVGSGSSSSESFIVQAGTSPVTPNGSNQITFSGTTNSAGTTPVHTEGSTNTMTLVVQLAQANASSNADIAGLSSFNSADFTVDDNGYVSAVSSGYARLVGVDTHFSPGTDPVVPTSGGLITVTGGQVAAGTTANVIQTDSTAASEYTIEIQRSQAVASSTVGDNGVSHFNSADFTVDENGFVSLLSGAGAFNSINIQTFTTSGTYTPSAGLAYCKVQLVGAGGGGGVCPNVANGSASGGGGGGYAEQLFDAAAIGASKSVVIGVGGTGGTPGSPTGGTGGTSSFGSLLSCVGGSGGTGGSTVGIYNFQGGVGGTSTGGIFSSAGQAGESSCYGTIAGSGSWALPGSGGSSFLGGGGVGGAVTTGGPGGNGGAPGAGGGGALYGSSTQYNGGNGGNGVCIVTEYIS